MSARRLSKNDEPEVEGLVETVSVDEEEATAFIADEDGSFGCESWMSSFNSVVLGGGGFLTEATCSENLATLE